MARKQLTEEQKVTTEFTALIEANEAFVTEISRLVGEIEARLHLGNNREACCALRDYAQLLVARHRDAMVRESQDRVAYLESQLRGKL